MSRSNKEYNCKWCHVNDNKLFYGADKTLYKNM